MHRPAPWGKIGTHNSRSGRFNYPGVAFTAEEKEEFAEMNLTDHAGVLLRCGTPTVNGVEINYAIGGAGDPVFLTQGVPKTMSY